MVNKTLECLIENGENELKDEVKVSKSDILHILKALEGIKRTLQPLLNK